MADSYHEWRKNPDRSPDAGAAITLVYTGELAPIVALGFVKHAVIGDLTFGLVRFRDVPALVAYDGVRWLAAGRPADLY